MLDRGAPAEQDLGHADGVGRVRPGDHVAHVDLVGQRLQRVDHVQVPGVERGVVRLADHPACRVQFVIGLGQHGQLAEVLHGGVPAHVALAHERAAVHRAEHHVVAADVHVVGRVAGLHVELARRLRHLLEHELRVELHHVAVHVLARLGEQLNGFGLGELDADLGDDPAPAAIEHRHRVGGEDLVPRHRVDEHRFHRAFEEQRVRGAALSAGCGRSLTDFRPGFTIT
jgi:hypothetical protein